MVIELRGVEFVNKGAELMMHAIIEKVRQKYPKAVITMQIGANTPKAKLKQYGIKVKFSSDKSNKIGLFIPPAIRRIAGYYLEKEIQIILDGSGFAFGDQWGATYADRRIGSQICKWHNQGKKIILLAQAFGPFENEDIKKVMEKIITNADLIFAREEESYKYLTGIKPATANIKQSPDFTNLISGIVPKGFDSTQHEVAIIPNYKMVESKSTNQDVYINFLKYAVEKTIELGLKPFFLIHEGAKDHRLAIAVNNLFSQPLPIIVKDDPLEVKGIISTSKFIICSRFHGVVSALSQGVPCIATSWSHKYAMLLKEYEFEEGLINDLTDFKKIDNLLSHLAQSDNRTLISAQLLHKSKIQKEKSAVMWDTVYELIDK